MSLLRAAGDKIKRVPALTALAALFVITAAVHAQEAAPKMQLPADQRAFAAARATIDPEQRLAAMQQFVQSYPKSRIVGQAQDDIFDTLVKYFPQRTDQIDKQAKLLPKLTAKGIYRFYYEADIANSLAEANETGIDLPRAEKFAKDATEKLTEAAFDKDAIDSAKKYKQPAPDMAEVHSNFASGRAGALAALAKVDMDEHKPQLATALLNEAYALDPNTSEVNLLRGELALDQHNDAAALEDFEHAQLTGELKSPWREKMMELYRNAHNGSDQTFTAEMDAEYARIFPAPFTPPQPKPAASNRTALLELFTGSACHPCISADLAVEALLKAYPRKELVVLAYDQHIPDPDPLANPDSIARAKFYGARFTPLSKLDGKTLWSGGGYRSRSNKEYDSAAKRIDEDTSKPTGVQMQLTADRSSDGMIHASASISIDNPEQLQQSLAPDPPAKDSEAKTEGKAKKVTTAAAPSPQPTPATPPIAVEPHLVANFALVEDEVRYSGENGIRFHRMVVRSLAQPADSGTPVEPGKTLNASFDPAAISSKLKDYLDGYEQKNDKFGKVTFLSKDTTFQPGHLAIVAWVEDTTTHRVLQAAFVPVGSAEAHLQAETGTAK